MQRSEFTDLVQRRADLESNEDADAATVATLSTLSERLTHGQAQDIAGQLSDELAGPLATAGEESATELNSEEFVNRVDRQLDEDGIEADARRCVQAVMETLSEGIDEEEWQGLIAQLPEEYEELYGL